MSASAKMATIMVAEDDVAVRELLTFMLETRGYNSVGVANTQDALRNFESRDVDLLLLDLGLGRENGISLLRTVRELPNGAQLPVILLTGRADRDTVQQAAQIGVQGYFLKRQLSRQD